MPSLLPRSVDAVSSLDREAFVGVLGGVFEGSPWIAERTWKRRPFADVEELHAALVAVVDAAGADAQLGLIRAHPDLAGKAAIAGELTEESSREQASAGLDRLSSQQYERLTALNDAYTARFGFPFVICAREHSAETIIASAAARVANDPDTERATALAEIAKIARLRLASLVSDPEDLP
jgi:OHCU decarboxylase